MRTLPFAIAATVILGTGLGASTTVVTAAEFIAAPAMTDTQVDIRFRRLDKDNDAVLTRSETLPYPVLTAQFINLDLDGDRRLSEGEFSGILTHPRRLAEVFSF